MKPEQLRARVLAEWRGLPEPLERPDRAAQVGDAVRKLMAGLNKDYAAHERAVADMLRSQRQAARSAGP